MHGILKHLKKYVCQNWNHMWLIFSVNIKLSVNKTHIYQCLYKYNNFGKIDTCFKTYIYIPYFISVWSNTVIWARAWQKQQTAPSEDLSASPCLSAVWSAISLRWALSESLRTQCIMMTVKTDQTGPMPRLIRVLACHTGHFVGFIMLRLNYVSS